MDTSFIVMFCVFLFNQGMCYTNSSQVFGTSLKSIWWIAGYVISIGNKEHKLLVKTDQCSLCTSMLLHTYQSNTWGRINWALLTTWVPNGLLLPALYSVTIWSTGSTMVSHYHGLIHLQKYYLLWYLITCQYLNCYSLVSACFSTPLFPLHNIFLHLAGHCSYSVLRSSGSSRNNYSRFNMHICKSGSG